MSGVLKLLRDIDTMHGPNAVRQDLRVNPGDGLNGQVTDRRVCMAAQQQSQARHGWVEPEQERADQVGTPTWKIGHRTAHEARPEKDPDQPFGTAGGSHNGQRPREGLAEEHEGARRKCFPDQRQQLLVTQRHVVGVRHDDRVGVFRQGLDQRLEQKPRSVEPW